MLAVCQIWNGEGSFPQRSLPDKALELPRVRPGRSHVGLGLGARFLIKTSYYSTTARKQPTEKWAKDFGRHFSKDDEEPISTWKGAPHHQKYQSKRRDHTSLIWAAVIKKKKKENNKFCQGSRKTGTCSYCWWEGKIVQLLWKKGVAPQKVKHRIPLLGTRPPDPKELEDFQYLYTNGNTTHNSPKVKTSQGSSTEEWIN